jgi:hypothetical protein
MSDEKNIFQKIGDAVVDYAPGLAGVLALVPGVGVIPAAALGAVAALGRSFGLGTTAKPEEVLAAVTAADPPELRLKAQQADNDFKIRMREADLAETNAYLTDTQGARKMRSDHEAITGNSDYNLYLLAWTIVVGFFGLMALLFKFSLPPDQNGVIFVLFGALASGFGQVLNFFFGSNKNSGSKTAMIYNSTPGVPKMDIK